MAAYPIKLYPVVTHSQATNVILEFNRQMFILPVCPTDAASFIWKIIFPSSAYIPQIYILS